MDWLSRNKLYLFVGVLTFIYSMFFIAVARVTADPHFANRGGALLAAIGAAAVVFQVVREMRLEGENETDEDLIADDISPQNRELAEKVVRSRREDRRLERLRVVVTIAGVLVVGEILHGWGDCIASLALHPAAHDQLLDQEPS